MKPLYLYRSDVQVGLDHGALRIRVKEGASDRWIPLRLISRVLSAETVDWTLEALLACARAGISVTFQDKDCRMIARCFGNPCERQELAQRLADLRFLPNWNEAYLNWIGRMDRIAARSVARRLRLEDYQSIQPADLRRMFDLAVRDLLAWPAWQILRRELHGQLHALAHHVLLERGVDPEHCETRELNLPSAFARILLWDFDLAIYRWIESRVETAPACPLPTRAEAVALFECRSERTARLAQGLVNRLHRWLVAVFP